MNQVRPDEDNRPAERQHRGAAATRPLPVSSARARGPSAEVAALRDALAQLRRVLDHTPVGLVAFDASGRITVAEGAAVRASGLAGRGIGQSVHDLASGKPELVRLVDEALAGNRGKAEVAMGQRTLEVSAMPIPDDNGGTRGAIAIALDVTRRKRVQDALSVSEARYRSWFENIHDVIYETDLGGTITLMSPSCLRHTGYTPDELVGMPVRMVWVDQAEYFALVTSLAEHGAVNDFEALLRRKDGVVVNASVNAQFRLDATGTPTGVSGSLRDITKRKAAEAERDRIFTLSLDMLAAFDADRRFQRVNPAWTRTLGYTEEDLLGRVALEFVHPEDRAEALAAGKRLLAGEEVRGLSVRFAAADGAYHWLSWSVAPTEAGSAYAVVRDVTELMENERQQRELLATVAAGARMLEEQAAALDAARAEAVHSANHDMLTGVLNRRAWFAQAVAERHSAIALFDIDHFKRINDTYGHPAGDSVLCQVAARLATALGDDALGRVGGEEFAALFTGPFENARAASEAALAAVASRPVKLPDGTEFLVTVSAGLSPWRPAGKSREASLAATYEEADDALYEAKRTGRRRLVLRAAA